MRKIKFKLLTQTELVVVETAARTFGELRTEVAANPALKDKITFGKNQFIERETKVSYGAIDEAILPATDCIMFVSPLETKLGALPSVSELQEMGYNELRSVGSKLNKDADAKIDLTGKRDDILDRLIEYVNAVQAPVENGADKAVEAIHSAVGTIKEATEVLKNAATKASVARPVVDNAAYKVTFDELEEEAKKLNAALKSCYYARK